MMKTKDEFLQSIKLMYPDYSLRDLNIRYWVCRKKLGLSEEETQARLYKELVKDRVQREIQDQIDRSNGWDY